jgi:thiol:disulfide interchange protein DsbA
MINSIDLSTRRFLKVMAAGTAALAAGCATRQGVEPEEGFEYRAVVPPVPTATKGKIEVVEFFWYACPFCNVIDPLVKEWLDRQQSDVVLRKVHVARSHQQSHYTLEAMGKAEELSATIFSAIHDQQMDLESRDRMADFVARHGVDRRRFVETFESAAVRTKMQQATEMAKAYKIDGVPSFGVNGKWFTSPSMVGGNNALAFRVLDILVVRERAGAS